MATETYPLVAQNPTYSAEQVRHLLGTMLARGANIGSIVGGLVGATDMQVTAGSGMQVLVGTGEAWIPGTSVSTQGGYLGRVTSSTALAISASSESNNRVDTIIAQVKDKAVAGGTDSFSVSVVTGTAESGVTKENKKGAGAIPASSLVLGYVFVEKKAVSIVSGDIENVATPVEAGLPVDGLSWGRIAAAGTIEAGSGDYTIAKTETGRYELKWKSEQTSAAYAVVATVSPSGAMVGGSIAATPAKSTVTFNVQEEGGIAKNTSFSFVALAAS